MSRSGMSRALEQTPPPTSAGSRPVNGAALGADRRRLILFALLLAAFAISIDSTVVNVALPTLVRELHASNSQLQWVVDAYNLVFAALLLMSGSLSDRYGRKGMLLCGLAVFGLSSLAGGFTSTVGGLIVARCFMGLGAAMIFPATLSLISNIFTERTERARAIGLWGATTGVALATGPIVGGWLLQTFSWSSIFFAMVPIAVLGGILVAYVVPTSRDPHAPKTDRGGFVLSTAAIALLIFTIIEAPAHGWGSARTLVGFGLTAVLFAIFITWERRALNPMLDIALFRNPRFTAASCAVTIAFFALFGFTFLMIQYFQFFDGYGPLSTGVHLLPFAFSIGVASVIGVRLAVRFGTKLVVSVGLLMMCSFYAWVSIADGFRSYWVIGSQMVLFGIGMGLTSAPATEAIMGVVPKDKAGVGSAINDATRLLGGTLGVAVMGSVYASLYGSRIKDLLSGVLPPEAVRSAQQSAGAALGIAAHLGHTPLADTVRHASRSAFLHGLTFAALVATGVAAVGTVVAFLLLPAQPLQVVEHTDGEEGTNEPVSPPFSTAAVKVYPEGAASAIAVSTSPSLTSHRPEKPLSG
jgi:EmrB/QacA subfamily drug resistance transporter